jgi:serine/threonine protein phosphatase 1
MRRFAIGDIHGAHRAMLQCLERSGFDYEKDLLISLGDICDGWPEVHQVFDELLRIENLKVILSNHDQWAFQWMKMNWQGEEWTSQGGDATIESYGGDRTNVPEEHCRLLQKAPLYLEMDGKLFVHGGIDPSRGMTSQDPDVLLWDRRLLHQAVQIHQKNPQHVFGSWKDIFIGHTTTEVYGQIEPLHVCNVRALDTGGGWSGKLTLMDIDSYEYWQSDRVPNLYPGIQGRN